MSGPVLAVDQGTSGTKALVVCPERGVVGTGFAEVRPRPLPGGLVEVDPEELYGSVLEAGRRALAEAGEPVSALGLANQGETVLAWDPHTGRPLTDALVWQDRRAESVCAELAAHAEELRHMTGLPLDPYFAAPKMAWIRRHLTREGHVTTSDTWLVHRLTGARVTDAATASRTQLLDLDRTDWSPRALELYGLRYEALPEIVDNAAHVGTTEAFGPELPLTGLAVDQQAALLAQRVTEPGTAKCTYGTGAFLLADTGATPRRGTSGLAACVARRLGGRTDYCLDGQVYTAASAVRWLTDLGVLRGAADLDPTGATVPDAGGVTFVPALAGLAAPWWRGDLRGSLTGLGLDTTPGHLVRALCEGIAAQVAELADAAAADLGAPLTVLRVDGGLTRSALLMQTQADLLQRPVEVSALPDATALGVGALARLGADPALTLADALPDAGPAAVYEPRVSADEAGTRRARFRTAVDALLAGEPA
ncbi:MULTISPECIES: FGGY family carbohydrate kinase [Streptomyces]|uniref:FGGY family carbohydrate kinase n=1 Tax=Streptomyces TaxID=1883 RepID=UPI001CCC647C|nr:MULTISPECIES: FGGY family carbohydrate kinase [Streptomyces]MBZ6138111.1 carbohydrate kinase [Streptomyces olivaceus]MBZ6169338.1 carbohydrate kinase [Streptomyces olivaceus]MBZ6171111.1 carbohydrate kinase [Streptomyces olivaceus]MBZ6177463.1 carbohydrate kinase [Streptomyces olivaceus]MCM8549755.1 FGGY family carbohydrate kinase [Streptomyces sp. STCH 565 A]